MRRKLLIVVLFCSITSATFSFAIAANRFYYENFEDNNFYDTFWTTNSSWCQQLNRLAITNQSPYSGSYSLRGNAHEGISDPITGRQGENNPHANTGGQNQAYLCGHGFDLTNQYSDELWVKIKLKWDANIVDKNVGVKLFIFGVPGGEFYCEQWGSSLNIYGTGIGSSANYNGNIDFFDDNQWHTYMVRVRPYQDITVWQDGIMANLCPLAYSGGKPNRVTFIYAHVYTTSSLGYQIDDIEYWDGMPTGINPPKNLRKVPTP